MLPFHLSEVLPQAENGSFINHVHIAKMAGRTIMNDFSSLSNIPKCDFQPKIFYRNEALNRQLLKTHCESSCFYSYEGNFDDFKKSCSSAFRITMLRKPIDWLISAASHYSVTLDDFDNPMNEYSDNLPLKRLSNSESFSEPTTLLENIFSMGFGIVEYFPESMMLLLYHVNRKEKARTWCYSTPRIKEFGVRNDATIIAANMSYKWYRTMMARPAIANYSLIYDVALAEFFRRHRVVHSELCETHSSSVFPPPTSSHPFIACDMIVIVTCTLGLMIVVLLLIVVWLRALNLRIAKHLPSISSYEKTLNRAYSDVSETAHSTMEGEEESLHLKNNTEATILHT